jgi:hypothetical protein
MLRLPRCAFAGGYASGLKAGFTSVGIADGQGAGVGEGRSGGVFSHRANGSAADQRCIVGARDGHSCRLRNLTAAGVVNGVAHHDGGLSPGAR